MRVPVNEPNLVGNEKKYLNECIDTGWISFEGPFVKKFEAGMAKLTNREFAVSVCNGSVALDTAILALEIGEGDEVIMPTFTIMSCAAAVARVGGKAVFVDSDLYTWNMNVAEIEKKITAKTKAIMIVHIYGLPVDVDPILELAKKHGLYVIEDAAEMHGQTYKGHPCGSFGDISTFSFYPNKHITCGEGGMLVTNNEKLAERCRLIRNLFFSPQKRYVHEELGYNFRMTNMQAAIGLAQFEKIQQTVEKKRWIGRKYTELLEDLRDFLILPIKNTDYAANIYWVYGVVLKENIKVSAEYIMKKLAEKEIGTRGFFYPLHKQPVFMKKNMYLNEKYPNAEYLAEKGFYLPSGLTLSETQISYVAAQLREILLEVKN